VGELYKSSKRLPILKEISENHTFQADKCRGYAHQYSDHRGKPSTARNSNSPIMSPRVHTKHLNLC